MIKQGNDATVFTSVGYRGSPAQPHIIMNGIEIQQVMLNGINNIPSCFIDSDINLSPYKRNSLNTVLLHNTLTTQRCIELMSGINGENPRHFDLICTCDPYSTLAGKLTKEKTGLPLIYQPDARYHNHNSHNLDDYSLKINQLLKETLPTTVRILVSNDQQKKVLENIVCPSRIKMLPDDQTKIAEIIKIYKRSSLVSA